MRVAICDDEESALKQIGSAVKKVLSEMNLKSIVSEFTDVKQLLNTKKHYDVVFLDVELENSDKNGIWAAGILKERNPDCFIIFVTNHEEYIDEVIEKYAFRYWSKPVDEYRLRKSMRLIVERMKSLSVHTWDTKKPVKIMLQNIIYVTPEDRHCRIVTDYGDCEAAETFKEVVACITADNFCCCHGSFCVNLNYVEKFSKLKVCLRCGARQYEVHMSRRYYGNFKEKLFIAGGEGV